MEEGVRSKFLTYTKYFWIYDKEQKKRYWCNYDSFFLILVEEAIAFQMVYNLERVRFKRVFQKELCKKKLGKPCSKYKNVKYE